MTAPGRGDFTTAFLHRAGLFAALLAVIAGILGMHVMTGTHGTHSPAAVTATDAVLTPITGTGHAESPPGHAGHSAPSGTVANSQSSVQDAAGTLEQCSCSGSCANGHAMTAACTPTAKTGSFSAPLPGTTVIAVISSGAADGMLPGLWSYLPDAPSPGELSISRT
ncbi:hypothetical protein QFZ30_000721 [Arthrobacter pascens]|uniref:hypothetical protein n=1 Tax=Arthrobacter pascens TaxID=1677 RepID=UPI00278E9A9B|nr:hypothetical protein [Arthrobacter pascens]MDQ0677339.1 hypothetical protein [Arthrobacter pascens]